MIFAANWKMNLSPNESLDFVQKLSETIDEAQHKQVWIFPQNYSLGLLEKVLRRTDISWGAQNIYPKGDGPFTGENSVSMLKSMGANLALVGHSERRKIFKESDLEVAEKAAYVQEQELVPLICIGETIEDREGDRTAAVLNEQLSAVLEKINLEKPFALAYEPVWAIGTGQVASPEQVEEAHQEIRSILKTKGNADLVEKTKILYGGSVKPENAQSLGKLQNVDGFLIGGASLSLDSFCQIIEQCK